MPKSKVVFVEIKLVYITEDDKGLIGGDGETPTIKIYPAGIKQDSLKKIIEDTEAALNSKFKLVP